MSPVAESQPAPARLPHRHHQDSSRYTLTMKLPELGRRTVQTEPLAAVPRCGCLHTPYCMLSGQTYLPNRKCIACAQICTLPMLVVRVEVPETQRRRCPWIREMQLTPRQSLAVV